LRVVVGVQHFKAKHVTLLDGGVYKHRKKLIFCCCEAKPGGRRFLTTETVEGSALSLERVHDVEGSHSLSASMLSVGDCVTHDVLEEDLEDTSGLLVDLARDTLNTSSASQSSDGWLLHNIQTNWMLVSGLKWWGKGANVP
jgi:hypothetical protein